MPCKGIYHIPTANSPVPNTQILFEYGLTPERLERLRAAVLSHLPFPHTPEPDWDGGSVTESDEESGLSPPEMQIDEEDEYVAELVKFMLHFGQVAAEELPSNDQ
ncbi:hypothetical protein TWF788_007588 [Orbilia oligospora]|uniref:Uncharacterized protein n=1 Tax=Orbilia oligospora TaxID=2813651 RepID=A0A7C8PSS6_ORBOL|nr:hypothetical protein TWF788_007588 [Orbilia oligospora]